MPPVLARGLSTVPNRNAQRPLPPRPSKEHLRKQAKRLAKERGIQLSAAQGLLAIEYGADSWSALMEQVDRADAAMDGARSPLAQAALNGSLHELRAAIDAGQLPDGASTEPPPLWLVCVSAASAEIRLEMADLLLGAGANPRRGVPGSTPLHAAAARGPLALVERLIAGGAVEWQPDGGGWSVLDAARTGSAPDRDEIISLVDRPVISDPQFRAAVRAIQIGDLVALTNLVDQLPGLLRDRAREPDCYHQSPRHQYFLDPKLFWFIANNPRLIDRMPPNMVEVARAMIARGIEAGDLDYTLELVMTSASARESGLQVPLLKTLLLAGAKPSPKSIAVTLAHKELEPIAALQAAGVPLCSAMAAGLGQAEDLRKLLRDATPGDVQLALALAVINGHEEAAKVALDFNADPNAFMPVHTHSVPLHQAVLTENIGLLRLLAARGARTDIRDKMWDGTPFDWALHERKAVSRDFLASLDP